MPTPATHCGIIVGVDGSPASKVAVDWAARDAAMRKVPLTVVNVLYPPTAGHTPMVSTSYMQWQEDEGRKILNDALKTVEESAKQLGPIDVSGELMTGPPVPTLVELSTDAEMVVVPWPWPRHARPAPARVGQHRAGPSRALPGCGHPRRKPTDAPPVTGTGAARYRRLTRIGVGHRDRLRRSVAPRSGTGRPACLE
jgi:nucleotide-binding universal stress UspA family protein